MSVHTLVDATRLIEIPDDLESFFHVLIYFAIRFLPHNLPDDAVGRFLYNYFDDYTDGLSGFTCGPGKYNAIMRGVIDLTTIAGSTVSDEVRQQRPLVFFAPRATPSNGNAPPTTNPSDGKDAAETENNKIAAANSGHPINALITDLLKAFQAFYAKDAVQTATDLVAPANPSGNTPAMLAARKKFQEAKARRGATSGKLPSVNGGLTGPNPELAQKVETHIGFQELFMEYLDGNRWPKIDKGDDKKPRGGYVPAKENTLVGSAIQTGTKRAAEDGEESMSMRVWSRSRV